MPRKQRHARRQDVNAIELSAWERLFDRNDYLFFEDEWEALGYDHEPTRADIFEAWRRFGRTYLTAGLPAAYALKAFGEPETAKFRLIMVLVDPPPGWTEDQVQRANERGFEPQREAIEAAKQYAARRWGAE